MTAVPRQPPPKQKFNALEPSHDGPDLTNALLNVFDLHG
jgi:hypothetical protein